MKKMYLVQGGEKRREEEMEREGVMGLFDLATSGGGGGLFLSSKIKRRIKNDKMDY